MPLIRPLPPLLPPPGPTGASKLAPHLDAFTAPRRGSACSPGRLLLAPPRRRVASSIAATLQERGDRDPTRCTPSLTSLEWEAEKFAQLCARHGGAPGGATAWQNSQALAVCASWPAPLADRLFASLRDTAMAPAVLRLAAHAAHTPTLGLACLAELAERHGHGAASQRLSALERGEGSRRAAQDLADVYLDLSHKAVGDGLPAFVLTTLGHACWRTMERVAGALNTGPFTRWAPLTQAMMALPPGGKGSGSIKIRHYRDSPMGVIAVLYADLAEVVSTSGPLANALAQAIAARLRAAPHQAHAIAGEESTFMRAAQLLASLAPADAPWPDRKTPLEQMQRAVDAAIPPALRAAGAQCEALKAVAQRLSQADTTVADAVTAAMTAFLRAPSGASWEQREAAAQRVIEAIPQVRQERRRLQALGYRVHERDWRQHYRLTAPRAGGGGARKAVHVTMELAHGLLANAAACSARIAGCYAPDGLYREKPLQNGLQAVTKFIVMRDGAGREMENAEVRFTSRGMYIERIYSSGHTVNTSGAWRAFLAHLLDEQAVPALFISPSGPLLDHVLPLQRPAKVVTLHRPPRPLGRFLPDAYHDSPLGRAVGRPLFSRADTVWLHCPDVLVVTPDDAYRAPVAAVMAAVAADPALRPLAFLYPQISAVVQRRLSDAPLEDLPQRMVAQFKPHLCKAGGPSPAQQVARLLDLVERCLIAA